MRKTKIGHLLILVISLSLFTACGGAADSQTADAGEAGRGQALFEESTLGPSVAPGCVTCHSIESGKTLVGPSLAGMAASASSKVAGKTAEEYLHESIVLPDAHVVDGFASGIMYQSYAKDLTEQEINDLVAYMLSLK